MDVHRLEAGAVKRRRHFHLTYACDTHYPWQEEEVIKGGRVKFEQGAVMVPINAPPESVSFNMKLLVETMISGATPRISG